MTKTLRPNWAELSQPGLMRTLDMVLDPEKTLEMEVVRAPKGRTTVPIPLIRQHIERHKTVQLLIALIAAMLVLMFATA